jgi:hypothetical protein
MNVDERKTRESERGYRCIRPDIHPSQRFILMLSTISTRRHRTVYTHPSSNSIYIRPPPYMETKKPCVCVVSGKAPPTIDISREDGEITLGLCTRGRGWDIGRCRRISAAEAGGCERLVFFDRWFRGKAVGERRCARERTRTRESSRYVESSASTVVSYPRYRKECELA